MLISSKYLEEENEITLAFEVEKFKGWATGLTLLHQRIAPRFKRAEPRKRVLAYLKGLISPLQRKNGWQLAEQASEATPDGMQRLLNKAVWEADEVRDDLQHYIVEYLGHPNATVVLDETGFLKKGEHSVGVKRQYSGTAGRVENSQIGVFLAYASPQRGRTLLDRELYLPKEWAEDPTRREAAGIPKDRQFATKPELARQMIERAVATALPFKWITGDEVYGGDRKLRRYLEEHDHFFALAVAVNEPLWYDLKDGRGPGQVKAEQIVKSLPAQGWQRLSCGEGTKGPRIYDWAIAPLFRLDWPGRGHWLLARRSLAKPEELAYYVVFGPETTELGELVEVVGQRWQIEESFEIAKGEFGLDHYEVRSWKGWYRHITLVMLAQAYLTVTRLEASRQEMEKSENSIEAESVAVALLPLSVPEVRGLIWELVWREPPSLWQILKWSWWRRRHQARAKRCHYKRRLAILLC